MKQLSRLAGILALVGGMAVAGACNKGPDPKESVSKALKDANIDDVNVDYDRDARLVHLKGAVDSSAERTRAEDIANTAVGTSGKVLNELTVKGMNEESADDLDGQIRDRLDKAIDDDPELKDRDINFDVNNGVVTIKGDVRSAAEKSHVGEIVKAAPGVKETANTLEIKPKK